MPNIALQHAMTVLQMHRMELHALPNVIGTASDVIQGEPAIVLFVTEKPAPGQLPSVLDGIRVYYQIGDVPGILQDRTTRIRPAVGGISCGHPAVTAGTISGIISIGETPYLLSNNHVIANANNANPGDPILQPGRHDGGSAPVDTIASLHSWKEIRPQPARDNLIDVAIATADPGLVEKLIMGTTPWEREVRRDLFLAESEVGMQVSKSGRTTAMTTNLIRFIDWSGFVFFGRHLGFVFFIDQIVVQNPFGAPGDSGSMVFTPEGHFIGLLWAGGDIGIVVCKSSHIVDWIEQTVGEMLLRPGAYGADPPDLPPEEGEIPWLTPVVGIGMLGGSLFTGLRNKIGGKA